MLVDGLGMGRGANQARHGKAPAGPAGLVMGACLLLACADAAPASSGTNIPLGTAGDGAANASATQPSSTGSGAGTGMATNAATGPQPGGTSNFTPAPAGDTASPAGGPDLSNTATPPATTPPATTPPATTPPATTPPATTPPATTPPATTPPATTPPTNDGPSTDPQVDPPAPASTSSEPKIPAVSGDCPNFSTGSWSFQGLRGEMDAGSPSMGTGSLLFYWHGTGGQAGNYKGLFGGIGSANIRKITSQGGIVFAVQGGSGGDLLCSGTAVFDGDFSVIDQVVACAVENHGIDPHRIYATGCSAGGLQSGCMAARRSSYVASVAPNSGGLVAPMPWQDSSHIPASMTMHGGAGDNVIINFGDSSRNFNTQVTRDGGFAIDCNHNSGHCGAPSSLYDLAIDFLLAHPFGVDPEPYSSLPAGFPSYCSIQ